MHETEVKVLKKNYEDHRELFDGVAKWHQNWTLYLELDVSFNVLIIVADKHFEQSTWCGHMYVCVCFHLRRRPMTLQGSTTEVETFSKKRNRELTCRKVCPR